MRNSGSASHEFGSIWRQWRFPVAFVALWSANEWLRTRPIFGFEVDQPITAPVRNPVLTEGLKLLLAVMYSAWHRRLSIAEFTKHKNPQDDSKPYEVLPLAVGATNGPANHERHSSGPTGREKPPHSSRFRIGRSTAFALLLLSAVIFVCYRQNIAIAEHLLDPFTQYLIGSLALILTAVASYLFLSRTYSISFLQTILLQACGICIVQSSIIVTPLSSSSIPFIAAAIFNTGVYFLCMEFIYTRIHSISPGPLHVILFTSTLVLSAIETSVRSAPLAASQLASHVSPTFSYDTSIASISQAIVDLGVLAAIYHYDAGTAATLLTCGPAVYVLGIALYARVLTIGLVTGCLITLIASIVYLTYDTIDAPEVWKNQPHWLVRLFTVVIAAVVGVWLFMAAPRGPEILSSLRNPYREQSLLQSIIAAQTTCHRKSPPSAAYYTGKRTYHAFDNVLLIVFFSHARYDVNLDYYREVYSEYFPNIVFVGPGSREDQGFRHSYDVLVDTYEADEDLSDPNFYKMAGRMAHHMLYTAMREYDCYDGYLWAPFDTLLNVPRLQQFDQRYFWYHSPFGQYVHNPALGNLEVNRNKDRHAPAANISPDPATNFLATWRHWGPDWWWGEPHVGVGVCMDAYVKVPLAMREHLASLTNGTRFIGGSSDTVYIPGRHRQSFMNTLGLFLETDCFLEIATPTVIHLVSPPEDPILFVDHWWIWQPPFNASFVRQQWKQGLEVDTFHTFHWGDTDENGVWKGEARHIEDVRMLLRESAERQGIRWTWGNSLSEST